MGVSNEQMVNASGCPECGSADTEFIEKETKITGELIRRFGCNECYAGYEVQYNAVSKETYHEPEAPDT